MALIIAAALIRQAGRVLLVEQQGHGDSTPTWSLPGGVARDGELLDEALQREVAEETGLVLSSLDRLAYVTQMDDLQAGVQSIAFVFESSHWSGELRISDPDGLILQACWQPLERAIERLDTLGWRRMREPLVAYLRGESAPGSLWLYRNTLDAGEELFLRVP